MAEAAQERAQRLEEIRSAFERNAGFWLPGHIGLLLAELDRMTAELDEVTQENAERARLLDFYMGQNAPVLKAERDAALADVKRLREALERFTWRERVLDPDWTTDLNHALDAIAATAPKPGGSDE